MNEQTPGSRPIAEEREVVWQRENEERIAALSPEQRQLRQEALGYLDTLCENGVSVNEFGGITERVEQARIIAKIDSDRLMANLNQARSPAESDLWQRIVRLPKNLEINPGISLVVGYNGMGKTTLARAIFVSALTSFYEMEIRAEQASLMARGHVDDKNYKSFTSPHEYALARALIAKTGLGGTAGVGKNMGLSDPLYEYIEADMISSRHEDGGKGLHRFLDVPSLKGVIEQRHADVLQDSLIPFDVHNSSGGVSQKIIGNLDDTIAEVEAERARQGSTRQAVDDLIPQVLDEYIGPRVVFMDEPETGMDPWRQQSFDRWFQQLADAEDYVSGEPKSTSLITTNSPHLVFHTDLPRIDLRMPERGVFRPSEVPGYQDIR